MIDYNKTDDEQAEDLKAWWKENGISVIAGIALAIAALFAWEYWQKYQIKTAKKYAEKGEYEPAITALRWAIDHTKDVDLKNVASIRLARVLASAGKYDEALQLASQSYGASYESVLEEIKGDIYSAQKKTEEARKAYERAILSAKNNSSELIKIKLDNLGKGA